MGDEVSRAIIPRSLIAGTGLAFLIAVFILGVYFAFTYQRPAIPSLPGEAIGSLAVEAIYLLGKLAFLSLALAAGVQLLRIGLSGGEE